jgi:hypothetical protein
MKEGASIFSGLVSLHFQPCTFEAQDYEVPPSAVFLIEV